MKVIQVVSSNIPIQETGERRWGALELIQREYQKNLHKMGVECEIKWLNEVQYAPDTIVHIHVANLCLEAKQRGIPYIYSNHDHTSVHLGKGSWLYKQQLEAIKGSVFSIAHGESVLDFFGETDKLFYLPHGVDTSYYLPSPACIRNTSLLMVASNGMAGDYGIDRKGFRLGIEAAKKMDLPITIVGSEANAKFFEIHSDLLNYQKLTIDSSNPKESDKLKYFQSHRLFLHPSYLEFGSPCLTLLEARSCALPMVAAYDGSMKIDGLNKLDRLDVDDICSRIQYTLDNYEAFVYVMRQNREKHDWSNITKQLHKMYQAALDSRKFEDTPTVQKRYIETYAKRD